MGSLGVVALCGWLLYVLVGCVGGVVWCCWRGLSICDVVECVCLWFVL